MNFTSRTICRRCLRYHWRTSVSVVLGVIAAAAALAGALFVGDSMRAGLRDLALKRLGPVEAALTGGRFIREEAAAEIEAKTAGADGSVDGGEVRICPIISSHAAIEHAEHRTRVNKIHLFGVDECFWSHFESTPVDAGPQPSDSRRQSDRIVRLNKPLADALGAQVGDDVLLRLEARADVPLETLLGRRDESVATLRLTVSGILPDHGPGAFALKPAQAVTNSAFVPLMALQRALAAPARVNTLLVASTDPGSEDRALIHELNAALANLLRLEDIDVRIRRDDARGIVVVESPRMLIEPAVERACLDAAQAADLTAAPILTYLANSIALSDGRNIPYSTVAALDPSQTPAGSIQLTDGRPLTTLHEGEIVLNEWAAEDLDAKPGDALTLAYFVTLPGGALEERTAAFTIRGIARMTDWAADASLTPTYEGITDAKRITDWDPPFPVDMKRIRPKDEDYWDRHKALPKAFISLADGLRLWAEGGGRFGAYTSIRVSAPPERPIKSAPGSAGGLSEIERDLTQRLLDKVSPNELDLTFQPLREQALTASGGSTDFGGLFIGFSSFLIIAAAMLVALVFRLGVERRAGEIGIMLAVGLGARRVARILLGEGLVLTAIGATLGIILAAGYAQLMLTLMQRQWPAALGAPVLRVAATPQSIAIGWAAGVAIGLLSITWSVRSLSRMSAHRLLAGGAVASRRSPSRSAARRWTTVMLILLIAAALTIAAPAVTKAVPMTAAFFIVGFLLLAVMLIALWRWLVGTATAVGAMPGVAWLSLRNAKRQPTRSLLAAGLVACATFVIVAVGANRHGEGDDVYEIGGPTGGYRLLAESVVLLPYDLASTAGQASLGLSLETSAVMQSLEDSRSDSPRIAAFRLRPGDDTSCLNLYQVQTPRILGARPSFIERGGFTFSSSMAKTEAERRNQWTLLDRKFPDGAVPAIGDESSVRWLLHLGLGDDLVIRDERGRDVPLRIVGMISDSILQGELVIAESRFIEAFPSISGFGFFLIAAPVEAAASLAPALEHDLSRFGMDVEPASQRLAAYRAIENVYLSTFQMLGGLGLVLGTIGLAAVMLRSIWERRAELALLRALGVSRRQLYRMCLCEHAALLICGLVAGTISAAVAVAPHAWSQAAAVPCAALSATLAAVFIVGIASGAAAIRSSLRTPLLSALRRE